MVSFCSNLARNHEGFRKTIGRTLVLLSLCLGGAITTFGQQPASEAKDEILDAWLAAQTNIHTWTSEFRQTRTLKALTQPLVTQGRVWFSAPNLFRWELGAPPQTIAIRQPDQMLVVYPILKRAEKYALNDMQAGPWRDALSLLEVGFPRNRSDLDSKFRIISQIQSNGIVTLTLQPKSSAARRMMPMIAIGFRTDQFTLESTELQFADGSKLRNDFMNSTINTETPPATFQFPFEDNYKITEPTKQRKTR